MRNGAGRPAGLEVGDVIVKFDGKDVKDSRDLPRIVASTPVGKEVDVTIVRNGDLALPVDVLLRFEGGRTYRSHWDGEARWKRYTSSLAEFEGRRFNQGRTTIQIRAGLSLGEPVGRGDGDLFGVSLIEAARLCSAATDGRGLATAEVTRAAGRALVPHGPTTLKGFDEPDRKSVV